MFKNTSKYAGNLRNYISNWRQITSDPWILETVAGYHLELENVPIQPSIPKAPPFNQTEIDLIDNEVSKLLEKGAITQVAPKDEEFISNIFLVPKKTGDMRPVINLKQLNQFAQKIHFKMENIQMALNFISQGDCMISIDLKDAYFSVPIFHPDRKYLRFIWREQRYEFTCLPFGYSLSPRVFTKIFKPIIAHLRLNGLRIVIFLDDILLAASSVPECKKQLAMLRKLIEDLGFIINEDKSQLKPVTRILYLGFIIDTKLMKVFLPENKIEKIKLACGNLLDNPRPTARQIANVTGLLVSAFPAVIYLKLYYRSIELCKSEALHSINNFDQPVRLSNQAISDLHWVINNISSLNGNLFGPRPIDLVIESDASLVGWGAFSHGQPAQGKWSELEASYHINYLELLAAFKALQTFVLVEKNIHVRLMLDNSTALAYINNLGGIKSTALDSLSRQIWEWCIERNIFLSAQHIPGKMNLRADALSRQFCSNLEWSLNTQIFEQVLKMSFTPEIDLFASQLNAKCTDYVSWHPDPNATAVDAFNINWTNLKCYAFPPFSLVPQVLKKIREDKALVLLIAPVWTTQTWFSPLLQLLIDRPILLPKGDSLLFLPQSNALHPLKDSLVLAAWMLSGNPSLTEAFLATQPTSSLHLGPMGLINSTTQHGKDGAVGVSKGKLIYFRHLWNT